MFQWYREGTSVERRTFWACFGGWALDALDVQMFSLVIPALIATWHVSKGDAGLIGSVTLITSALGGWLGGALADRIGRIKALQVTVLWFALATFLAAFTQSFEQLLVTKALQGFGFGGEWAAGAVLMAEIIRPAHRGKALGAVQSAWAVGWGAAVLLYTGFFSVLPEETAWRALFAVGLLPAAFVLYVRRGIPEPVRPEASRADTNFLKTLFGIFRPETLRATLVGGLFGLGAHGGYYSVTTWLPTFLKTERHLSVLGTGSYLAVIILAFWCGCVAAGQLLDRFGRRRTVALFALGCILVATIYVALPISNTAMLFLGFPLGFCAAGIPASMGTLFNELYPSGIRGTGVGFCYNFGRILSSIFPAVIGYLSSSMSLGLAIGIDAAFAYSLVLAAVLMLPETRAKALDSAPATGFAGPSTQSAIVTRRDFTAGGLAAMSLAAAGPARAAASSKDQILAIDCHAHVFTHDLQLAGERRYAPEYDASIDDHWAMLQRHGMSHGVLVQPSFLGTDNSYLLRAIAAHPGRIRGIAVVAPDTERAELDRLAAAGIVGLRLNLIGQPDPDFAQPVWQKHLADLAALGWQVEIQAEARRLPTLLPPLLAAGPTIVIDHFGKFDPALGVEDPGFKYLLEAGRTGRVWVKLSGAYRCGGVERGPALTLDAMPRLKDAFGLERLVWGSDWPHTQFEKVTDYDTARGLLDRWLPDPAERNQVLTDSPARQAKFA